MSISGLLAVLELPTPDFSALEFEDDCHDELCARCDEQRAEAIDLLDAEAAQ